MNCLHFALIEILYDNGLVNRCKDDHDVEELLRLLMTKLSDIFTFTELQHVESVLQHFTKDEIAHLASGEVSEVRELYATRDVSEHDARCIEAVLNTAFETTIVLDAH